MTILLDILSWLLLVGGGFLIFTGALGMLRFPDFFTRLHAASVTETLGVWSILAGLMLQSGFTQASLKLLLIAVVMFVTGPTATHALAKAALHGKLKPLGVERD
ncbi:MAG: sodium:proton antiporter [Thiotrichales bacterium]|nr:sodium:proton antiporter [Thiotrichales bacterium]